MKIKLGSFVTDAKGIIGGTYVGSQRGTKFMARKRSRSGQPQLKRANNLRLIQFYSNNWTKLTTAQRNTWIKTYGSQLKGFRQYVTQLVMREYSGATTQTSVSLSAPLEPRIVNQIIYTPATQSLTISFTGGNTAPGVGMIQIRNYTSRQSAKGQSGWLKITTFLKNNTGNIDIGTPIKATGRVINNTTSFQLRVVQSNNSLAPVQFLAPITINTALL